MRAGPSDALVVADETAAGMLAQGKHDPMAAAILVSTGRPAALLTGAFRPAAAEHAADAAGAQVCRGVLAEAKKHAAARLGFSPCKGVATAAR